MGNEYGVSPFQVLQLLGPSLFIGPLVVWFLVIGPLVIYPVARWKTHRAELADTQIGIKVALHFFALIAFQILLFAGAFIIYTVLSKEDGKSGMYRMGFGLLIPAAFVFAAHFGLLRRTNQDAFPIVRRLFLGYNMILTGLLGFAALLFLFQVFTRKGTAGDEGRFAIAFTLVYVGAWTASGIQFARLVFGDDSAAAPPQNLAPPSASAPQTQASGPVLPSLSAGSFPPLDGK